LVDVLKIGIISFAHMHALSYLNQLSKRNDVRVVGGWDEDRQRAASALVEYELPTFGRLEDLLATDIDAVIVCSENVRHAEHVVAAARAGKHVLCEKPLGTTSLDMQEMITTCREHGVQLMTAFPCRYFTSVRETKAALDRGDIGAVIAIKGLNRGTMPGGWFVDRTKSGGGAVLDHTVHLLDLMRWFLNDEPRTVYAEAGKLFHHSLSVEDAGIVHVTFEGGTTAVLDTSWSRGPGFPAWGDVTMEIIGTEGVISLDALAQKNDLYVHASGHEEWSYWGDDADEGMLEAFIEAIRSGSAVPITGEDGKAAAEVALAAYESIQSGVPVEIGRSCE
jgi:myo-inositol 2-dehydrogenase/D-chiro-inositol 1-dehydrogenase